jgi:hypothetical protein
MEVSYAILAAVGFDVSGNCGGQYLGWFDLA